MDKTTISIGPCETALSAIACTGDIPDISDKVALRKVFRDFAARTKHTLMTVYAGDINYIPASPKNPMERFVLLTPDHTAIAVVVLVHAATGLVQYQFNPSEMTEDGRVQFDALLQISLNEGYVSLYRYGKVSMAEYSVDVDDLAISDVVLVDTGHRRYTLTDEGTTYCGCRRSELVGVIYDKGSELRRKNPAFVSTRLRYEVRRRARGYMLEQWVQSGCKDNPFAPFIAVPRHALRAVVGNSKAEQIRNFGLRAVVKNRPAREALTQKLEAYTYAWSEPVHVWMQCRNHLIPSLYPPELKS